MFESTLKEKDDRIYELTKELMRIERSNQSIEEEYSKCYSSHYSSQIEALKEKYEQKIRLQRDEVEY